MALTIKKDWRREKYQSESGARYSKNIWRKKPNIADPLQQMKAISLVEFETQRLLNREEFPILYLLERSIRNYNSSFRVMAQTSLGELIQPRKGSGTLDQRELAYRSINSKRLDFSVIDRSGRLVLAVEYQGSGHYHRNSFLRDAVKREALRKAGVHLLEIPVNYDPDIIDKEIHRILQSRVSDNRPSAISEPSPLQEVGGSSRSTT